MPMYACIFGSLFYFKANSFVLDKQLNNACHTGIQSNLFAFIVYASLLMAAIFSVIIVFILRLEFHLIKKQADS